MKVTKQLLTLSLVTMVGLIFAAAIQAKTEVADVIPLKNKAYEKHTKGIVEFTHKKHSTEYGASCGECHHDDKGQPLDLKEGDDVQNCIECHKIPSTVPKELKKEWKEKKVSKDEQKKLKLEYHAEAIHINCKDCHKKWNKENNSKAAPVTCSKCHPKTEK
jgi:hypothetical protein